MTRVLPFGLLLIDKPRGPTSHDIVAWVRWALRIKSVGHCGTLDPGATGLLVVCIGAATRFAGRLTADDKCYDAEFCFGTATDTWDADGVVLEQSDPDPGRAQLQAAADELRALAEEGMTRLPPPAYSALNTGGTRAHALARAGLEPELDARPMQISAVEALELDVDRCEAQITARLGVSKGTYIRSIAVEIGRRIGLPAHLHRLHRVRSGLLSLEHVSAVKGLSTQRLPDRPGRPSKFRIRAPEGAGDRKATGEFLRRHLLAPWSYLGLPVVREPREALLAALDKLVQGQRLAARGPWALPWQQQLAQSPGDHFVMLDDPGHRCVLVRRDRIDGEESRWAPERVIAWVD